MIGPAASDPPVSGSARAFGHCCDRRPAHERAAYLDKLCGNNPPLRQLVDAFLGYHDRPARQQFVFLLRTYRDDLALAPLLNVGDDEHFVTPAVVVEGRYRAPVAPGSGAEMLETSIEKYRRDAGD